MQSPPFMNKLLRLISSLIIFTNLIIMLAPTKVAAASYTHNSRRHSLNVYAGEDFAAMSDVDVELMGMVRLGMLPARPEVQIKWEVIKGDKSNVDLSDNSISRPSVSFHESGSYTLRLSARTTFDSDYDDVVVWVNAFRPPPGPVNDPPYVDIGEADEMELPSYPGVYHFKNAEVSDDGFPIPPGEVTVNWRAELLPSDGSVEFSDPNELNPIVKFDGLGKYKLKLCASDGEKSSYSEVIVNVLYVRPAPGVPNDPPQVDIGEDDDLYIEDNPGTYYFRNAEVHDDGFPDPPNILIIKWTVVEKPYNGEVEFLEGDNKVKAKVRFTNHGIYRLRLTADDGEKIGTDEIEVQVYHVRPVPDPVNNAPYVDINEDEDLYISSDPGEYRFRYAWIADDGYPDPPGRLDIEWSLVTSENGGEVEFLDGACEIHTTVRFSKPDIYVLRLSASDGVKSGYDEVVVEVFEARPVSIPEEKKDIKEIIESDVIYEEMIKWTKVLFFSIF